MIRSRIAQAHDDRGVALVAAMGVALIGMMVATVVIAQTIMAANDSGRDRLRTTEVHSAEGVIDAVMNRLESESPCTVAPEVFGAGTQATSVSLEIDYFNDDSATPIDCPGGVLAALPNRATVRATSVGVQDSQGLNPERTVEASLKLEPRVKLTNQAAIFSADSLTTSSGLVLSPKLLDQMADVWIDDGDWYCNVPATITGGLYLPDGGLRFNSGCYVSGDTYVENDFNITGVVAGKTTIGGNLTIRSGQLKHTANLKMGQDVTVGGAKQGGGWTVTSPGPQKYGVGASSIANLNSVGIPQIDFNFARDWAPLGFVKKNVADMKSALVASWNITPAQTWRSDPLNNCEYHGWIAEGRPLKLPAGNTVYDLRACNTVLVNNNFTMELYGDTALIVKNFNSTGNVTIKSGDGQPHKLWIISPIAGGGYTPGNITSAPELRVQSPVETFWYTPGTLELRSTSALIGQAYGGKVTMASPVAFEYTDVGVPGHSLVSAVQSSSGFVVELLGKREVS